MKKSLCLLLLVAQNSFAFTLNSTSDSNFKGWNDAHVYFNLNLTNCPAGVDVRGIFEDAMDVWNHVTSSRLRLTIYETTTSTTYSNPVTVFCDTNYGSGNPSVANGSPGVASILPVNGDEITSAYISLNASGGSANIANLNRDLVVITIAHEIGHAIGLGHSQSRAALMYYDIAAKEHVALTQDDVDGVTYLYPRNEIDGDGLAGCGRIRNTSPPSGPKILLSLLLLLFPLGLLLKKRLGHAF